MVTENFKTVPELYRRVLPALKSKRKELELKKLGFITENDIWNCLRRTKWARDADILNIEPEKLLEFLKPSKR